MSDTGWLNPGSIVSQAPGDVAWTKPGNAAAEDSTYASVGLDVSQSSEQLYASDFGAALPSGATDITVEVRVVRHFKADGFGAQVADYIVQLTPGGSPDGDDRASEAWPETTPDEFIYGGDNWGLSLNDGIVNHTNFGVIFSGREASGSAGATAYVDNIQVRITYTGGGGGANTTNFFQFI